MNMNKPPDETLKQGRNRSWLLIKLTVKVLLCNDENIVRDEYKNSIIFLSFVYFCSLFSQYLEKGKKPHGFLIDSESSKKGLQN